MTSIPGRRADEGSTAGSGFQLGGPAAFIALVGTVVVVASSTGAFLKIDLFWPWIAGIALQLCAFALAFINRNVV